jgi:hypothetical protein
MKKPSEKKITDEKIIYLVRTLSRTKRKDYENYVVNAIWNRLNDDSLKIETQHYIYNSKSRKKNKNGKIENRYFIDLYFPDLNIGIECNEAFHKKQTKADKRREAEIKDSSRKRQAQRLQEAAMYGTLIKKQVNNRKYLPIYIDVTKNYQNIQNQIDKAVEIIKREKAKIDPPPKWEIHDAKEYYKKKDEITICDDVGFKTVNQTCNILFSTKYDLSGRAVGSYFTPEKLKKSNSDYKDYKLWFPKLAVRDKNNKFIAATNKGWWNQLKNNGKIIIEKNKNVSKKNVSESDKKPRIVFAYYKDSLGDIEYRFIGIFQFVRVKRGIRYYNRVGDKCKILKK